MPTICITEVFSRPLQQRGKDTALMQQGNVVNLDSATALEAARLGYRHNIPLPTVLSWRLHICIKPESDAEPRF